MRLFKLNVNLLDYKTMYEEVLNDYERVLGENKVLQEKCDTLVSVHNEDVAKYDTLITKHAVLKADYAERNANACDLLGGIGTLEERIERTINEYNLLREGLGYMKEEIAKRDERISELMAENLEPKETNEKGDYDVLYAEYEILAASYKKAQETIDTLTEKLDQCTNG